MTRGRIQRSFTFEILSNYATFNVGESEFLLTALGSSFHAVRPAQQFAHEQFENWQPRTVCGREWFHPGDPDGEPEYGWGPAIAPTCRSCLRTVTKDLAETPPDDRLQRLATAMAESVVTFGSAECSGVPGDQAERLRASSKSLLRGRTGKLQSLHQNHLVVIIDDDHPGHPDTEAAMRAALENLGKPVGHPVSQPWLFHWHEWDSLA